MQRVAPVLLCLILILGGLCAGLCTADQPHACCHEKNHCGHPVLTIQSHAAVAVFDGAPVVLNGPAAVPVMHFAMLEIARPQWNVSPPPLRVLVLRI